VQHQFIDNRILGADIGGFIMSVKKAVSTSTKLSAPSALDGIEVDERKVVVNFNHPQDLQEAVEMFKETPVFDRFMASLCIEEQKAVRNAVLWTPDYSPDTATAKAQQVADSFSLEVAIKGRKLTPEQKEARKTDQALSVWEKLVKAEEAGTISEKGQQVLAAIRASALGSKAKHVPK